MKKIFVINFEDGIIFEKEKDGLFYAKEYESFKDAKSVLISHWQNEVQDSLFKLKEAKKLKQKDVKTLF